MEKRKRPKLKTGHLATGSVFYFYRKPSTLQGKRKSAAADADVRPSQKKSAKKDD